MSVRLALRERLGMGSRTAFSLARELHIGRHDIEDELRHVIRSAVSAGEHVDVEPSRCKKCGFLFDASRLTKPSKCPSCGGSRIYEALIAIRQ